MFKRFIDGLVFGAGLSISFVVVWVISTTLLLPFVLENTYEGLSNTSIPAPSEPTSSRDWASESGDVAPYHQPTIDERIAESSAIALAVYEKSTDGRMRAVITEYLKLEKGTEIKFSVSDEHPVSSYYPVEGESRGDGLIIFFKGSPAAWSGTTSVYDGLLKGMNNIPLELFREKCVEGTSNLAAASGRKQITRYLVFMNNSYS